MQHQGKNQINSLQRNTTAQKVVLCWRLVGDKIDYIFHLASPVSPIDYLDLSIQTLKVGALGTYNMLDVAEEQGARFLLASTSVLSAAVVIDIWSRWNAPHFARGGCLRGFVDQ